jgi:hypothetical protein
MAGLDPAISMLERNVIAGSSPRLSGSFLLDRVHGVDSTPYRAFR